jgi:hypothetical protein
LVQINKLAKKRRFRFDIKSIQTILILKHPKRSEEARDKWELSNFVIYGMSGSIYCTRKNDAAPTPGNNFDEALAPTLLCSKGKFLK